MIYIYIYMYDTTSLYEYHMIKYFSKPEKEMENNFL